MNPWPYLTSNLHVICVCVYVIFNAVAARAQPPLRPTSRRVYGVESRRPITIARYSSNRPPNRALWLLYVLSVPGSRWCPSSILEFCGLRPDMSGEGGLPKQAPRTCSDLYKTIPAPVLG
ncbi:hypothetical protein BDP81DRAFT_121650 [Colletotrichum phormii]|uniref:Uncharacterized protein n=1 Tax=Colletotrichum phormii TaxID=359342 RepID=A0AAI9ZHE7_9PEZI|nr:uncharacterized protein BDP81DRAFT_121650 [Colletotrichum phormii]KAK1623394.1 hypothetical protein BDP81DRAFT_121650 [Colletotrichum phormii]